MRMLLVLAIVAVHLALPCDARQSAAPTDATSSVNGEVFDQVWTIIRDTHAAGTLDDSKWEEARTRLRGRAISATDNQSLRSVLRELLQTLEESHFAIIPGSDPDAADVAGGWSGMSLQFIGDEVIVTHVAAESPAARANVKTGWKFVSCDGKSVAETVKPFGAPKSSLERLARDRAVDAVVGGEPGSDATATFTDIDGAEHTVTMTLGNPPGELVTFGNLPPFPAEATWNWLSRSQVEALGGSPSAASRIGLLRFSIWMTPLSAKIDAALIEFRSADGIVIDLRGNPGGLGMMATGVAGHFLAEPTSLGAMQGRGMKLDFKTNPRIVDSTGRDVGIFSGPVAILIDSHTGSTSEIFAAGLLEVGRAQAFGQTSAGAALPATTQNLANGDVLLHAIGDFRTPSGTTVEGIGVRQLGAAPTRLDYTSCSDPELRDALRWIARERKKRQIDSPTSPKPPAPTP